MTAWTNLPLSKLGTINRGKSKHRPRNDPKLFGGDYPFIQTSDVKHAGFYINLYSETYNETGLAQSKLWSRNTLCMTIAANIGETALLSFPACFPDSVVGFTEDPEKSNVKFIKYSLDYYKKQYQERSQGAAQDNLSLEKIESLKLKVPPVSLQKKIADIIFAYDNLIENNEKRIKILEEMAKRLYTEWFVKFKFPGHEKIILVNGLPEGWEIKKIKDIGKVITGKTPSTSKLENFNGDILFIKTPDLHGNIFIIETEQTLSDMGARSQGLKMLPEKTVFVSCIGTLGIVGITSKLSQTNQQINAIVADEEGDYCMLYFFVKSLRKQLMGLGANGATMGNVNRDKFENIKILYPDKGIREEFFKLTSNLFNEILNLEKQIQTLTKTRDLLIPQLVTGRRELKA